MGPVFCPTEDKSRRQYSGSERRSLHPDICYRQGRGEDKDRSHPDVEFEWYPRGKSPRLLVTNCRIGPNLRDSFVARDRGSALRLYVAPALQPLLGCCRLLALELHGSRNVSFSHFLRSATGKKGRRWLIILPALVKACARLPRRAKKDRMGGGLRH